MGKECVFCGMPLGLLGKETIACGGAYQLACKKCFAEVTQMPMEERAQYALDTGRAVEADKVRDWMEERKTEREKNRQRRMSGKSCLRCGAPMLKCGVKTFKLGAETIFMSDLNRLAAGSMDMELLRCEACGKAELFLPEDVEDDGGPLGPEVN